MMLRTHNYAALKVNSITMARMFDPDVIRRHFRFDAGNGVTLYTVRGGG